VQARKTPRKVVSAATRMLLSIQRPNGWSANSDRKLASDRCSGQGTTARSRSRKPAFDGTLVIARLWPPENAMVSTQRMG
jgi:hypothetical protein